MPPSPQATGQGAATPAAHRADAAWLALILVIGAALRVREALRTPMWFDEIYTWWASRGGPLEAVAVAAQDVHPPLHFLLLGAWGVLGDATLWLRSQSILFGLMALVVTFLMTRDMFGRGAAFIATAMLAVHPMHVYFSQEVRSYALLWLLLPCTWWFAWRWVVFARRRDAVLYLASAVLALYTHYFAGIVLAFSGAWGVLALIREPRRLAQWLGWNVLAAALFAPQLPTLLEQVARQGDSHWIRPQSIRTLANWARHIAYSALYMVPVFIIAAALPLFRRRQRLAASLLIPLAAIPPALLWWLTARGAHLFTERYMYYALPAAAALVAGGVAGLPHRLLRWGIPVLLVLFGARSLWLRHPMEEGLLLQDALRYIQSNVNRGDVVFAADTHSLLFLEHHAPKLARYRLIWPTPEVPYYEGAAVIPKSLQVDPARFEAYTGRWWGIQTVHGGVYGQDAANLFRQEARYPALTFGTVTLWGPQDKEPSR